MASEPSITGSFVLPCIAVCGIYIYVPHTHKPGVYIRFYRLDLKKEMVITENSMDKLDLLMMKKIAADSVTYGKTLAPYVTCMINNSLGKVAGVLF